MSDGKCMEAYIFYLEFFEKLTFCGETYVMFDQLKPNFA